MDHQFNKKLRLGFGLIFLSIFLLGGLSFWLSRKIEKDAANAALSQAAIVQYSNAVAVLAELKNRAPEVDFYLNRLGALLPTKEELIEFPKFLEEQGRVHQVVVSFSFRGGAVTEPQGQEPGNAGFTLEARGSLERLERFFEEFETGSAKFISALDSLDVNLAGEDYRATAQGRVFFK